MSRDLDELRPERRIGLATLTLVGTRREYWVALGAIASYADEEERSIPDQLAVLSPAGEFAYSGAEQIASWAMAQSFSGGLHDRGEMTTAIYTIGSACRPESIAIAAETGGLFVICQQAYEPDWERVWECVRRGGV